NPFSLIPGAWAGQDPLRSWRLAAINGIGAAAIIAAVAFRLSRAQMPSYAVQQELILISAGVLFAIIAIGVRASRLATSLAIQVLLMIVSTVLTVLVLGVAGPWLGDDLPPLAAAAFATILLHFELGLHARHFAYLFAVAIAGVGALWIYAATQLMVSFSAIAIWSFVLLGLGLLAFLTRRSVDREMRVQVDRQASLLLSISDLGEGLLITEDGRYVGSNDAYVKLTGYTQAELRALPSLIDLAPPEDQEMLRATYSKRAAGDVSPVRYEAGLVTKDGRRVQVEVAIHQIDSEGPHRLLALVSDITERHRAEQA